MDEKIRGLELELKRYQEKLEQMQKDWSATREGSHYGNEYLEIQIKVYQSMIIETKKELLKNKRK